MIDKGYYDYDSTDERPRKPIDRNFLSDDAVASLLSGAVLPDTGERVFKESADDLQKLAMED